jgi:hypothetical protein
MLSSLDSETQRDKLERSHRLLEELCGDAVEPIAYLFGDVGGDATVARSAPPNAGWPAPAMKNR